MVESPDGFEQSVIYDWEPVYCKKCSKVGHECKGKVEYNQPRMNTIFFNTRNWELY